MKEAACIVILDGNKILATHRRNNKDDWGLPGGKLEIGETPEEAIKRELMEETGYYAENVEYIRTCEDNHGYIVHCFKCNPNNLSFLNENNENLGKWVDKSLVLSGCFSNFNNNLFTYMGISK